MEVEFRYGIEDLDPMDSQALLTRDAIEKYMGVPLSHVPPPEGSPHPNYARHFATLFLETSQSWASTPALLDERAVRFRSHGSIHRQSALDKADVILNIYRTVSTVNHPAGGCRSA